MRNDIKSVRLCPISSGTQIIAFLGPGEIFGEYEAFSGAAVPLEFSLVCKSIKGEVLSIDRDDFSKKISVFSSALTNIIDKSKEKRLIYYRLILNKRRVEKKTKLAEMNGIIESLIVTNRRSQLKVEPKSFYGSSFSITKDKNMSQLSLNVDQLKDLRRFRVASVV